MFDFQLRHSSGEKWGVKCGSRVSKFIIQIFSVDLLAFIIKHYRRDSSFVLIHLKLHKFNFTCKPRSSRASGSAVRFQ